MDAETGFEILARSAGDELMAFLGEPRPAVSREGILEASRAVLAMLRESWPDLSADPEDASEELLVDIANEVRAQAMEAGWFAQFSPKLTVPSKRAEMMAFIEQHTGRPLGSPR